MKKSILKCSTNSLKHAVVLLSVTTGLSSALSSVAIAADSSKVKQKAAETTAAVGDYVKDNQAEFEKQMHSDLDSLKSQIDDLKVKAMHSTGEVQNKLDQQIADLDVKRMILNKRLNDASAKSGKAWGEVKSGLSRAFDDLKAGFNKAKETASGVPDALPDSKADSKSDGKAVKK